MLHNEPYKIHVLSHIKGENIRRNKCGWPNSSCRLREELIWLVSDFTQYVEAAVGIL